MRNLAYKNSQECHKFFVVKVLVHKRLECDTKVSFTKQNGYFFFHAQISSREHPVQQFEDVWSTNITC